MAVDETSFTTITGTEITRSLLVQWMVNYYNALFEVGDTRVTDFNEGSEIRNLLEAVAVDFYALMEDQYELSKIAFIETAEGEWLDKHGAMPNINIIRDTGLEAEGTVTFTLPESATTQTVVPIDTVISCTENGLDYITESDGVIISGQTSCTVSAKCMVVGEFGNCSANTITEITSDTGIAGLTVTNEDAFSRGTDYEEDEEYRERLLAFEQRNTFGSLPYYDDLAHTVEGVHDVVFYDKTGTTVTKTVIVNSYTKPVPDSVILDITEVFNDVNNVIIGHTFSFEKVAYFDVALDITLSVEEELDDDEINAWLTTYFNGGNADQGTDFEGLGIGESLFGYKLKTVLELLDGITVTSIEYDGSELDELSLTGANQYKVFRYDATNSTITQNVVE